MASKKISNTSDQGFSTDVLESTTPVLVDFWAPWCGPCRTLAPHLDDLADDLDGKLKIVKINIDENPQVPAQYQIQSIPTLLLFKNGSLVDKMIGNPGSSSKIRAFVESNL